jgi:transcriptional regulator with XRE-family HTH domain
MQGQAMTHDQASAIEQRIGARMMLARKQRRMTAIELADRAGIHRNTIHRIEAGLNSCTIANLFRIANALGIQPHELFP